jgi:hypothetical protein
LRVGVTLGAGHLLWRSFVYQALYIFMTIHARQLHRSVDRMLELLPIDK